MCCLIILWLDYIFCPKNTNFQLKGKETKYVMFFFHLKSEIISIIFLDPILVTIAVDSETILLHLSSDIINLSEPEAYILMGSRSPGSFIFIFSKYSFQWPVSQTELFQQCSRQLWFSPMVEYLLKKSSFSEAWMELQ